MKSAPPCLDATTLASAHLPLAYKTCLRTARFGDLSLELQCLEGLDQTIDQLYDFFQERHKGAPNAVSLSDADLEKWCPYFGVFWASAGALSEEVFELYAREANPKTLKVLEIGCGLALPSILLARLGVASVVASDSHAEVSHFLSANCARNNITNLKFEPMSYKEPISGAILDAGPFDWIIGSDILYERGQAETLAKTLGLLNQKALRSSQSKILIADPGRGYLQAFVDALGPQGLKSKVHIRETRFPETKEVFMIEINGN